MDILDIQNKIDLLKSQGYKADYILHVIETTIQKHSSLEKTVEKMMDESRMDESFAKADLKEKHFQRHKKVILEKTVRIAHHKLLFKGVDEMAEYLEENFTLIPEK